MKVLIVEDNQQVTETLADFLEVEGIDVDCAYNGYSAIALVQQHHYDVIIMDIMMPKLDGILATQRLRKEMRCQIPILFLSAKDGLQDKQAAFDAGGDDYLIKPFAMAELLMRLHALNKRGPQRDLAQLTFGDLQLDTLTHRVTRANSPLKLSHIQFKILQLLMQKAPGIVTRSEIIHDVWNDQPPSSDALRSHIYGLRNAIDKDYPITYLETLHGKGYRLK
ncbi:response regulator transcription factor [Thaumasiovibrio sp. DFM-14]|uniref:response regulator transcription factor n=1 Tax=Thaumasiovibrio sp. DFM-14 TaxID=3384792 RepID=UPI0039A0ECC9